MPSPMFRSRLRLTPPSPVLPGIATAAAIFYIFARIQPNPPEPAYWFLTIHDIQRRGDVEDAPHPGGMTGILDFPATRRRVANVDFPATHRRMANIADPTAVRRRAANVDFDAIHRRVREHAAEIYGRLPTAKELAWHVAAKLVSDIKSLPGNVAAGYRFIRKLWP
ncbi:hypothetical protein PG984_015721 [Apiospora sp. TS-2023a]